MSTGSSPDFGRFGEKLRFLRTSSGITLAQMAAHLGYKAHGHLSEIEVGKKVPTVGLVLKVASFFGVSTDALLKDELKIPDHTVHPVTSPDNSVVFAHRPPTEVELARFRLLLSTFQDGTGMQAIENSSATLPGWRDFERTAALAFSGVPSESKDIMDVRLPDPLRQGVFFGVSCKMRLEQKYGKRNGRVTIELSNANRAFWNRLAEERITNDNYRNCAPRVGAALINLVRAWHVSAGIASGGNVDLARSCYLTLTWNWSGEYQLHQFPIDLPDPERLVWSCPQVKRKGVLRDGNTIRGYDDSGMLFAWYGQSGGQLKYYPKVSDAIWQSDVFGLELLPANTRHGLISKAGEYYPELWG